MIMTKPFAPRVISTHSSAPGHFRPSSTPHARISLGDLAIVPDEAKVSPAVKRFISPRLNSIALRTCRQPWQGVSREALLDKVWGYDYFGDGRLVDVHIRRLRTKVEADPATRHVVTVRGLGYRLRRNLPIFRATSSRRRATSARHNRWSLRRRILVTFATGAIFLAVLLAVTPKAELKCCATGDQTSVETAKRNAQITQTAQGPAATAQPALDALAAFGVTMLLCGVPTGDATGNYEPVCLPQSLVDRVIEDAVPARMVADVVTTTSSLWPLANNGAFFEFFSLARLTQRCRAYVFRCTSQVV